MTARVCVLTPDARGAVAVVRIWGRDALTLVDSVFRPARGGALSASPFGAIRFGRAGKGLGDEVVAVVVADREHEPPEVELHCHGGPAPLSLVVSALVAAGARRSRPESWLRSDSASRLQAQAFADLASAPTLRSAEILLEQAHGALGREAAAVQQAIGDTNAATALIDALIARSCVGLRLVRGWTVVLAGRPNVGKSRLLNALAGYERAIVDPTPGTTRDVVTVRTALDGWPVELADTAGLRAASDPLEAAGITRSHARQAAADLTLLVLDRAEPLTRDDRALLCSRPDALVVVNKVDLPASWNEHDLSMPRCVAISAQSGAGLEELVARIAARLVPSPIEASAGVPFRAGHVRRLRAARVALDFHDSSRAVECLRWFAAMPETS
jgi:tRNA modification GTPase